MHSDNTLMRNCTRRPASPRAFGLVSFEASVGDACTSVFGVACFRPRCTYSGAASALW
nr:MAG: hypothetical protein [Molluscum contagiosum virus]